MFGNISWYDLNEFTMNSDDFSKYKQTWWFEVRFTTICVSHMYEKWYTLPKSSLTYVNKDWTGKLKNEIQYNPIHSKQKYSGPKSLT